MVDARTATAADFDKAAQKNANAFWVWLVAAGIVWWLASIWWAALPAALALWTGCTSMSCTRYANKLRNGTFPIPNPDNGLDDRL